MIKTKNTPLWVFLAFSAIETRKGALLLVWSCVAFSIYCIPWVLLLGETLGEFGKQVLLIDDWEWLTMMIPLTLWYFICLIWMDKHGGWDPQPAESEI